MKNTTKNAFVILLKLSLLILVFFCSCDGDTDSSWPNQESVNTPHEHTFSSSWTSDETKHWHAATCEHNIIDSLEEHIWDDGVVSVYPTHTSSGTKEYTCSVCKRQRIESIPALIGSHTFSAEWTYDETNHWHIATCGHNEKKDYAQHSFNGSTCSVCGYVKLFSLDVNGYLRVNDSSKIKGDIIIPSIIDGKPVEGIGNNAFNSCVNLKSITLPNTVTTIQTGAFQNCSQLISIIIPSTVEEIGSFAFEGCTKLVSITIPLTVNVIKESTFKNCSNLKELTIPSSVKTIESNAFENCSSLASIIIPQTVISIGQGVFKGCTASVLFAEGTTSIPEYALFNAQGVSSITIPSSVTRIGNLAFYGCTGEVILEDGIEEIPENAFYHSSISSVTIPSSVEYVGENAFKDCTCLSRITIGKSINKIKEAVFTDFTGEVVFSDDVYRIPEYALSMKSGITSVTFQADICEIQRRAFYGCTDLKTVSFTNVNFNSSLTIGEEAFANCTSLSSIVIPNCFNIGNYAFVRCSALVTTTIIASDCDLSFGTRPFDMCTGSLIIESDYLTSIPNEVFSQSCFSSIVINAPVTIIGDYALYNCRELEELTIPKSVSTIGEYAFGYCEKLTKINFTGRKDQWESINKKTNWKNHVPSKAVIHCTNGDIQIKESY